MNFRTVIFLILVMCFAITGCTTNTNQSTGLEKPTSSPPVQKEIVESNTDTSKTTIGPADIDKTLGEIDTAFETANSDIPDLSNEDIGL